MLRKTIIVYCALAVGATSITELWPLNYPQKLPGCYIWSQYCGIVALNYPPEIAGMLYLEPVLRNCAP